MTYVRKHIRKRCYSKDYLYKLLEHNLIIDFVVHGTLFLEKEILDDIVISWKVS